MAGCRETRHGDFSVGSELKAVEEAHHEASRSSNHERLERCERSRYLTKLPNGHGASASVGVANGRRGCWHLPRAGMLTALVSRFVVGL